MANSATLRAGTHVPARPLERGRAPAGPLLCLRTWLRRPWLDSALANGRIRSRDRAFALRRAQLVERPQRIRLARRFEEALAAPPAPSALSSAVPVDRDAVETARPVLTELILTLRSSEPVEACGVALGWRLFTDPRSPIYGAPAGPSDDPYRLFRESLAVVLALRPADSPLDVGELVAIES